MPTRGIYSRSLDSGSAEIKVQCSCTQEFRDTKTIEGWSGAETEPRTECAECVLYKKRKACFPRLTWCTTGAGGGIKGHCSVSWTETKPLERRTQSEQPDRPSPCSGPNGVAWILPWSDPWEFGSFPGPYLWDTGCSPELGVWPSAPGLFFN